MKKFILSLFFSFFFCVNYAFSLKLENPVPTDSRIFIPIYDPDSFIRINFSKNIKSMLVLQKNEQIQLISIGDPASWKLENIDNNLLFIKPLDSSLKTNMIIITNKRTYLLEAFSVENEEEEDVAYVIKFYYPELNPDTPFKKSKQKKQIGLPDSKDSGDAKVEEEIENTMEDVNLKKNPSTGLNFDYSYAGKDADILPIKIFDNGLKTFLQFKTKNFAPNIYIVKRGREYKAKTSFEGSYVVLDVTVEQLSIRDNDKLVCIFNKKMLKKDLKDIK